MSDNEIRLSQMIMGFGPGAMIDLCEQTDMPLTEVAIASGFSSQSALSRKFKDRYQVTPSEMRSSTR